MYVNKESICLSVYKSVTEAPAVPCFLIFFLNDIKPSLYSGAVLSLAMTSSGEQCFSGGIDSTIQWWNIPSSNVDPYDTYGT